MEGFRGGRAGGMLVALLAVVALTACSPSADKGQSVSQQQQAGAAGQRAYIDPQTGKLRAPTAAEKTAEAEAAKQQQKKAEGQQKAQLETRGRIEKIPGGGTLLHLNSADWPEEKVKLDGNKQGAKQQ